ncbi:MAG: DUF748 domain-containing protein [Bacteroidota bacterium]
MVPTSDVMRRTQLIAVVITSLSSACAHGGGDGPAPLVKTPAVSPAAATTDPAPGARPEERDHVIEAQWKEVVVKARRTTSGAAKQPGKRAPKGEVVAAVELIEPKLRLFHAAPPPEPPAEAAAKAAKQKEPPKEAPRHPAESIDLAQELRKITPLDVDHIDILDGQVAFIDTSRKERPEIWLHDLQLSVENLPTRVPLTEGRPLLLTVSGTLAHSGTVTVFITADPFEKGLTFSGRAAVVGLQTSELYKFIEPVTDMHAPRGTVDIFVEFDCRNGELTGGVKPVLKNVEIRPADKNLLTVIKAWASDLAIGIFSDRIPPRNAVATVIPIKGTLNGPDIQLWPTIFGIMRNAFVEGLTSGYAHLPPATAGEKEGVLQQGVDSLTGSAPPKAQPTAQPDPAPPPPASPKSPGTRKRSAPSPEVP